MFFLLRRSICVSGADSLWIVVTDVVIYPHIIFCCCNIHSLSASCICRRSLNRATVRIGGRILRMNSRFTYNCVIISIIVFYSTEFRNCPGTKCHPVKDFVSLFFNFPRLYLLYAWMFSSQYRPFFDIIPHGRPHHLTELQNSHSQLNGWLFQRKLHKLHMFIIIFCSIWFEFVLGHVEDYYHMYMAKKLRNSKKSNLDSWKTNIKSNFFCIDEHMEIHWVILYVHL